MFGRFISTERDEPPDIDVDFEHERREEVMQYVYKKYGGNRTGLTANVISYRSKSAMREIGKVFGLSDDVDRRAQPAALGLGGRRSSRRASGRSGSIRMIPTLAQVLEMRRASCSGFPRHLSQHVGGFVITRDPLDIWCRSARRRWKAAPSSNGTRTTSMRSASSRSMCWRSAC